MRALRRIENVVYKKRYFKEWRPSEQVQARNLKRGNQNEWALKDHFNNTSKHATNNESLSSEWHDGQQSRLDLRGRGVEMKKVGEIVPDDPSRPKHQKIMKNQYLSFCFVQRL